MLPDRWRFNPAEAEAGDYPLSVWLLDAEGEGETLAEAQTIIRVCPRRAGEGRDVSLLIIGDSITQASVYPNELARLLARPGNPAWRLLGTHRPAGAAAGVVHEGYDGWTWGHFGRRWAPSREQEGALRSSPFMFSEGSGAPTLDVGRYLSAHGGGGRPVYVTVLARDQ